MKGFFTNKMVEKRQGTKALADPCEVCKLYKSAMSPRMEYTGKGEKGILIVGEAPGHTEDEDWKRRGYDVPTQFIGKSGQFLREVLDRHKLSLDIDFWKTNAVCCRPPKNRVPTKRELKLCHDRLYQTIEKLKPRMIWLLGGTAVDSFYINKFKKVSIAKLRGLCVPDKQTDAWVVSLFHPSYILKKRDEGLKSLFKRDIKNAVSWMNKDRPVFEDLESQVSIVVDFEEAKNCLLSTLNESTEVAFDYETTSLKPYRKGHKIWSLGVCDDVGNCYAIPVDYPHWSDDELDELDELWEDILLCDEIKKIAHNLKFEEMWTRQIYKVKPTNWHWCTMNAAHIVDDRAGFTGLKFQSYINYGIEDYSKDVDKFIAPKGDDFINRLDQVPLSKLLLYNGLDALLTYKLYKDQKQHFEKNSDLGRANEFCVKGLLAFADAQDHGIMMNEEYYHDQVSDLEHKVKIMYSELMESDEAIKFKKVTGKELNTRSSLHMKELLFSILELEPIKLTTTGKPSVDKEALAAIDIPFTRKLTEMRVLDKIKGTYLAQFVREIEDGKMHPFFDLHTARTYRSCVAKGTLVLTATDRLQYPQGKPIESVKSGDLVYCFDDQLRPSVEKVVWSGKTGHKEVVRIHYSSKGGGGHGYLDLTPEHLVRLTDGRYVPAEDLAGDFRTEDEFSRKLPKIRVLSSKRVGDTIRFTGHLVHGCGSFVPGNHIITNVVRLNRKVDVYDIETERSHNFIANEICVHNSSSMPNFQNIPVRNELAKKVTRSGIIPSPGNMLCEVDYGSIEVRIAACFTKDPVLVKYINNPDSCMHRDQAKKIFKMSTDQVMKSVDGGSTNLRFYTKNQFVFPEFYGSWYKACASNIWENCFGFSIDGVSVKDHIGMTYAQFEKHVKSIEDEFWKRFKVFKKWQEATIKNYYKTGYVNLLFGHRRGGYLSHNKIINTPIQGTAFHLLLWSLTRVNEISKEENWKTKIIGQIHDSIIFDLDPSEQDHVFKVVKKVMCEDVRKANSWIIVPLDVDFEVTPVDGSWYMKDDAIKVNGVWRRKKEVANE